VKRIILTASGGPFRDWPAERIQRATREEALNHPTWKMGPAITIDSATLMNKSLEIVEARWLFDLPPEQIEVICHPQSIIHSLVEFVDGSVMAQMGVPDMRVPIQYAMTFPERGRSPRRPSTWRAIARLTFEAVDRKKFPSVDLAYEVLRRGGVSGAVFNAANEVGRARASSRGRSPSLRSCARPSAPSSATPPAGPSRDVATPGLEALLDADRWAREEAGRCL
jgi:1-deoxy-D-xylulose-5-phosphate reductoisomerase